MYRFTPLALGLTALALLDGTAAQAQNQGQGQNSNLLLDSSIVADNAESNGNPTKGQAASLTSAQFGDNFINFCANPAGSQGLTITNGLQNPQGSCNPIVMGAMPPQASMVSTVIKSPQNAATLPANQQFQVQLQTENIQAGVFTNPDNTYYNAPQQLNAQKNVIGHAHVTIQNIGSAQPQTPPDAKTFAFFKGIDDAGDGRGGLTATVTKGLPAGDYRICTMMSAANHQPVLMPIAQRGAQDDCIRIKVTNAGNGNAGNGNAGTGNAGNGNAGNGNAGNGNAGNGNAGNGNAGNAAAAAATTTTTTTAAAAATNNAGNTGGNRGGNRGGDNNGNQNQDQGQGQGQAGDAAAAAATTTTTTTAAGSAQQTGAAANRQPGQGQGQRGTGGRGKYRQYRRYYSGNTEARERFAARDLIV